MKRTFRVLGLTVAVAAILVMALAGSALAANGYTEAAPQSGDGIPNGSGFDGEVGAGAGPAPNAGDGIPDGSGF